MIDFSSQHTPYVMAAFAFTTCVLTSLTVWVVSADRKARKKLQKKESVEIVFHHELDYEAKICKTDESQGVFSQSSYRKKRQQASKKEI